MVIKFRKVREDAQVPIRVADYSSGYDAIASIVLDRFTREPIQELPITIGYGEVALIGIGIQMAIPWPHEIQVRPRSGIASKNLVQLLNSPGTIDADFRGEAGVLLINWEKKPFKIEKGMRIAQLVIGEIKAPVFEETDKLPPTKRGAGGFGSSGLFGAGFGVAAYEAAIREKDEYYMGITLKAAERSRCVRGVKRINAVYERDSKGKLIGQIRKFGCIIEKNERIISQGYNAQYLGSELCEEIGCLREELNIPSGTRIEDCRAMHAEWWAITNLAHGGGGDTMGATMHINAEPCKICAKIISGLGLEAVVMLEGVYPDNGVEILREAGINIRYVKL